jgi:hypothetical protein
MKVVKYNNNYKVQWDQFVRTSRNGTFHVERGFIEYHRDRFTDHSLMVLDEKNNIVTLIALHEEDKNLFSHKGLTYAGFILSPDTRLEENLAAFRLIIEYCIACGFETFYYKTISHMYHRVPSHDDLVLLFLLNASLKVRHVNPVIERFNKMPYQERRRRAIKKAEKENLSIELCDQHETYWEILIELLARYDSKPVHSFEEISHLAQLFPESIKLYAAMHEGRIMAGILVFESSTVAKFQYIVSSDEGKDIGALDFLTDRLIHDIYKDKAFIDFGTSTLTGGAKLSIGISNQKEGFGARTTVQDHYQLDLKQINWSNLDNYIQ